MRNIAIYILSVATICLAFFGVAEVVENDTHATSVNQHRCEQVKRFWDMSDFTARFTPHLVDSSEPSACKDAYYTHHEWHSNTSTYDPSWERCEQIKRWWDYGGWTERFGSTVEPANCKWAYFSESTWYDETHPQGNPSIYRCEQVKRLWELPNFTSEFTPWLVTLTEASNCKSLYYGYEWWNVTLYQPTNPTWDRCEEVKGLWDEGNWTSRFGSTFEPGLCKVLYFDYGVWDTNLNPTPTPDHDRCLQIKRMWDLGNFTSEFTPHMATLSEAAACKEEYYSHYEWNNNTSSYNPSWDRCEQVKRWWDFGGWTERFGSTYEPGQCKIQYFSHQAWADQTHPQGNPGITRCEQVKRLWELPNFTSRFTPWLTSTMEAANCKSLYFGNDWWNQTQYQTTNPTWDRCEEVKELWDEGNWTSRFGSITEPAACKQLYFSHSAWEQDSNLGGDEPPPAGYEDDVLTYFTENPFPDTDINSLEGIAAAELYRRGVIGGYPDGEFKGYRDVNRAEAAKFLLLARYGSVPDLANNGQFPDVVEGQWYVPYVVYAANLGIINGYPDGYYRPANTVNTAEFLKMLTLTFDIQLNLPHSFNDVTPQDWFNQYAGAVPMYNLFPERSNLYLDPAKNMTRKEVAIAIYQFLLNR